MTYIILVYTKYMLIFKNVAHLTNNKDVFLCILRYHCRRGLVQQYEQMLEDMLDGNEPAAGESESRQVAMDQEKIQQALTGDRNFSITCELGVRYPVLKAILSREDLHISTSVTHSYLWFMSFFYWYYTWYIYCIYKVYVLIIQSYILYILGIYWVYTWYRQQYVCFI